MSLSQKYPEAYPTHPITRGPFYPSVSHAAVSPKAHSASLFVNTVESGPDLPICLRGLSCSEPASPL